MITMVMSQAVLSVVFGLLALVHADDPKSSSVLDALGGDFLYREFACRNKVNGLRLPIAESCVDYYECRNGMAERLSCRDGFHFSTFGLTCLDARISKCKADQRALPNNCMGQCCGRDNGIYSVMGSCSDYVVCVNGYPFLKSCGGQLQFSAESLICDVPERARCSSVIGKDIMKENSQVVDQKQKPTMFLISRQVCSSKANGYNVAVPGSCNKFYLCMNGVGYLKSCGNMHFNPEKQYCDSAKRMYCPEFEDDDIILDEDEYVPISTLPMPVPLPKPQPDPEQFDENNNVARPIKSPPKGKKGDKLKKKLEPGQKPLPNVRPEENQAEELVHVLTPWGKQPVQAEQETIPQQYVGRPHGNRRPIYEESESEEDQLVHGPLSPNQRPPHKGNQRPPHPVIEIPDSSEIEQEQLQSNKRPIHKNKKPSKPEPSYLDSDEHDIELPSSNANVCSNQPVGALLPMPNECSKYIRCRWDYFERRVAEVLTCPTELHFNVKTKYCDLPSKAGCKARMESQRSGSKS